MGKVWELAPGPPQGAGREADLRPRDRRRPGDRPRRRASCRRPRNFREIARVGPLANQAARIEETLRRPRRRPGVAIVAAAEEMAVNESIALEATCSTPGRRLRRRPRSSPTASTRERFTAAERRARASRAAAAADGAPAPRSPRPPPRSRARAAQREQLARLRAAVDGADRPSCRSSSRRASAPHELDALAGGGRDERVGRARSSPGTSICICVGLRRRRQDDDLGGDRGGHGGPRQAGRGADDRPGEAARRLARASTSSATPSAGSTRRSSSAAGVDPGGGELWATMLDAEGDVRRGGRAPRPRRGGARADPRQPDLPADLGSARRLAGVHGDGEALRDPRARRLRPARPRHAAVAQRARLPRRARSGSSSSSRGARCGSSSRPAGYRRPDRRPRRLGRLLGARAGSPAST